MAEVLEIQSSSHSHSFEYSTALSQDSENKSTSKISMVFDQSKQACWHWSRITLSERIRRMLLIEKEYIDRADELAKTLTVECKKIQAESYLAEVIGTKEVFRFWNKNIAKILSPQKISFNPLNFPGKSAVIEKEARGILGLITPWNYPLALAIRNLVPALLAGNCIIHKPSEYNPKTALLIQKIFEKHLPHGVLQTVIGGKEAGKALTDLDLDGIIFIGSLSAGKEISQKAGSKMIPVSLELGGKDPALVLSDASLERTVAGIIWGAFHNAGQDCSSIERVYIPYDQKEKYLGEFKNQVEQIPIGNFASMMNYDGFIKAKRHIEDAVANDAKVLCGNEFDESRLFVKPTILYDVQNHLMIMQEESFAPILPIHFYKSEDEVIQFINQSEYGLSASIWTDNIDLGKAFAKKIEAGMVTINNHSVSAANPALPWVGRKNSGSGITNSFFTLDFMTKPKLYAIDQYRKKELWWYPYNEVLNKMIRAVLLTLSGNVRKTITGFMKLIPLLTKRF